MYIYSYHVRESLVQYLNSQMVAFIKIICTSHELSNVYMSHEHKHKCNMQSIAYMTWQVPFMHACIPTLQLHSIRTLQYHITSQGCYPCLYVTSIQSTMEPQLRLLQLLICHPYVVTCSIDCTVQKLCTYQLSKMAGNSVN